MPIKKWMYVLGSKNSVFFFFLGGGGGGGQVVGMLVEQDF